MKRILIVSMTLLLLALAGCGDESKTSSAVDATAAENDNIVSGSVGESIAVLNKRGDEQYEVVVSDPVTPYTPPPGSSLAEGGGMTFDLKAGYKYVMFPLQITNNTGYPGGFFPGDYLLFDERGYIGLQSGVVEISAGDEHLCRYGGDILPGESAECSFVYQIPENATATTLEIRHLGYLDRVIEIELL